MVAINIISAFPSDKGISEAMSKGAVAAAEAERSEVTTDPRDWITANRASRSEKPKSIAFLLLLKLQSEGCLGSVELSRSSGTTIFAVHVHSAPSIAAVLHLFGAGVRCRRRVTRKR